MRPDHVACLAADVGHAMPRLPGFRHDLLGVPRGCVSSFLSIPYLEVRLAPCPEGLSQKIHDGIRADASVLHFRGPGLRKAVEMTAKNVDIPQRALVHHPGLFTFVDPVGYEIEGVLKPLERTHRPLSPRRLGRDR